MFSSLSCSSQPGRSRVFLPSRPFSRLYLVKAPTAFCGLSLLLLAAGPPAHAQYGPPPNTGSWSDPTTIFNGYASSTSTQQGITTTITHQPYTSYYPSQADSASSDNRFPSHVDMQGTCTMTRVWSGPGPAPKTVFIKETSYASGYGGVYGSVLGTGTAQDALGDPLVSFPGGASSSGSKLIQMDASSGKISLSGTMSVSGDTPVLPDWPSQGLTEVNSSFSWDFDSRAVTISSSIDTTYRRVASSPPTSAANVPGSDGTVDADTIAPDDNGVAELITYTAN